MMRSLRQYIRQLIREETHAFHGYKFGPDKVGLPGPEFDDADTVTDEDVEDAAKWLEDNDPTELVAFSRGSAVLHQMMSDKPGVKVPSVTYVSPAALRKWTKAPVPPVPGGSKVVHSMGDNIVPLKQGCQIAAQSGAEMVVVPGMGDGKDHIKALKYKGGGGTGVDAAACANDPELPDWGESGNASDEELEAQIKRAEELISEVNLLREYIRELLTEAAMGLADLPDGVFVKIETDPHGATIFYAKSTGQPNVSKTAGDHVIDGEIMLEKPSPNWYGPCGNAWEVQGSRAKQGWGPMLYDVAMEYATLHGGGLMSDRDSVSGAARKVWKYYAENRGDVSGIQMDDLKNTLTPEEADNCAQSSAGPNSIGADWGAPSDWTESPLSKRWTKPPTVMNALRAAGKLVEP